MIGLLSFLALIFVVITIHELGHYFAARLCGVKVLRFSIGFGKPLISRFDRAGTEWVVAPIPLGGYIEPLTRDDATRRCLSHSKTIEGQSSLRQIFIYAAGPFMNLLLAFFIMVGLTWGDNLRVAPKIGFIAENSHINLRVLSPGDVITKVNEVEVFTWNDARKEIVKSVVYERPITIFTERATATIPGGYISPDGNIKYRLGIFPDLPHVKNIIQKVERKSQSDRAGFLSGDVLIGVGDKSISNWNDFIATFSLVDGSKNLVSVKRDSGIYNLTIIFEDSGLDRDFLGITPEFDNELFAQTAVTVNYSFTETLLRSAVDILNVTFIGFIAIFNIITGEMSFIDNISGPISIVGFAGDAAQEGFRAWWLLVLIISISVMIMNLLPIPLLDGGRILQAIVELIYRKPLPQKVTGAFNMVGGALIFALMVTTLIIDVSRL